MLNLQASQTAEEDLTLRGQLRDKQAKMLAFLYNVEFEVAYEKFNEKYAPFSELKKQKKSKKINSEQVRRMLNALSEKLHEKIIRQDNECDRALSKLQTLWENRKIQPFHRYYFEKYLYSTYLQNIHTLIKNQDYLIRREQHIYFSILRAIWARQACINHIGRSLKEMGPQDMYEHFHTVKERQVEKNRKIQQKEYKVHGYRAKYRLDEKETNLEKTKMQTLGEDLNNYRKLTVHLVDLIKQWKFYMLSLTHDLRVRRERIEYYHKQENYLLHILNDFNFIATSFLNKFYTFALRNDPFLLKPIFSIEKKQEELGQLNLEGYLLKKIIICKLSELHNIMASIEHLYDEVEFNIRNRKIIDPKAFNKAKNMALEDMNQVQYPKNHASSLGKLNIYQSYRSQKLTPIIKMEKHIPSSMAKSNVLIRKTSLPKQISTKTIYGNIFRSQNPQRNNDYNDYKIIDSEALKSLKEEVYKKVKHDLEYQTKRTLLQSKQFIELVDQQVRIGMKAIVEEEQRHLLKTSLEVTALSFFEEEISSFITSIFKILPIPYYQIQKNQQDIIKLLALIQYCYILKIHTSTLEIAYVIASVNRLIKQYKSIEIELIAFKDPELLERIMLRIVQFVWKYENAKEIIFNLKYENKLMEDFIKNLQKKLGENCKIFEKKYRTHVESKFIFLKKALNQNYAYNPYPQKIHFKLYAALCIEPVQLQTLLEENTNPHIDYDYLIMEILRRYTNSEDFLVLRDTFRSKDRFRHLLTQLMQVDSHKKEIQIQVTSLTAENISELNTKLQHMRKPFLDITDLIKINNIKMLQLEDTLTFSYQLRVLSTRQGLKCHRYTIREEIEYFVDSEGTQFFKLPVQQSHHLNILLFKGTKYLEKCKTGLNLYLFDRLERLKGKWRKKYIDHLWIQMVRFPQNFTWRQDHFLQTYRCSDFASIGKELIMGDIFDWSTDIQIQNGFQYRPAKGDLHMTLPLGIGVITSKDWMLYARIFT